MSPRPSARRTALQLLRDARPRGVTNHEFMQAGCGSRFGGRIQQLRDAGHVIASRRLDGPTWLYTLIFDVERDTCTPEQKTSDPGLGGHSPSAGVSLGDGTGAGHERGLAAESPSSTSDRGSSEGDSAPLASLFDDTPTADRLPAMYRDIDEEAA